MLKNLELNLSNENEAVVSSSWTRITNNLMNVFSGVSYRLVFSYRSGLPVGFSFTLTIGSKPQVSGIKIAF